jgi:hypothetical protein
MRYKSIFLPKKNDEIQIFKVWLTHQHKWMQVLFWQRYWYGCCYSFLKDLIFPDHLIYVLDLWKIIPSNWINNNLGACGIIASINICKKRNICKWLHKKIWKRIFYNCRVCWWYKYNWNFWRAFKSYKLFKERI